MIFLKNSISNSLNFTVFFNGDKAKLLKIIIENFKRL